VPRGASTSSALTARCTKRPSRHATPRCRPAGEEGPRPGAAAPLVSRGRTHPTPQSLAAVIHVASRVGAARGGGDLGECLVEGACRVFRAEATGTPTARCIPPADFAATLVEAHAHGNVQPVVTSALWTYQVNVLSRDNSTSTPGQKPPSDLRQGKSPASGAFLMRPRGLEPPRTNQSTRPSTRSAPCGCSEQRPNRANCGVFWTHWTRWKGWMLSRVLSRRMTTSVLL
jgi:hypothetical protein